MIDIWNTLADAGLRAGIVTAGGLRAGEHGDGVLRAELEELVARRAEEDFPPEDIKGAVRGLLRTKAYKPSGRGKPASEYLAGSARKGDFPFIDDLVDANNRVSLGTGLPSSILDAGRFEGGLRLRLGREGESYVFNSTGQEIALEGLIVACRALDDTPLGNPVKDSLEGKVGPETRSVLAVIYAPLALQSTLEEALALYQHCLVRQGGREVSGRIL